MSTKRAAPFATLILLVVVLAGLLIAWAAGGLLTGNRLEIPAEPREVVVGEVRVVIPSSWFYAETPSGQRGDMEVVALTTPHGSQTTWIAVVQDENGEPTSLEEVARWGLARLEGKVDLKVESETVEQVLSKNVIVREYSWTRSLPLQATTSMWCRAVYAAAGVERAGYALEMCCAASDRGQLAEVFMRAERSFVESLP